MMCTPVVISGVGYRQGDGHDTQLGKRFPESPVDWGEPRPPAPGNDHN